MPSRRTSPTSPREEGPALDLGELDWTFPPDTASGPEPRASLRWIAVRIRTAGVHSTVSMMATGLVLGLWWVTGRPPTADADLGLFALLLHLGAFISAWLALRASVDAWQALYLREGKTPPSGNITQLVSLSSAAVMCFHAAMVLSSLLA